MTSKNLSDATRKIAPSISRIRGWIDGNRARGNEPKVSAAIGTTADFPLFDHDWYLTQYPDVATEGLDPKVHFKRHGRFEARQPSAYFDTTFYINTYLDGFLDQDPVEHYLQSGWRQGHAPNPYFSPSWYLSHNADVAEANVEPLWHYVMFGWKEGRTPSPYFDPRHYLEANPDIRAAGIEPMMHYMVYGHGENGRNPNAFFDTHWYRTRYMSDALDQRHPLLHYQTVGAAHGNWPGPRFDPVYYLENNPDIAGAVEPLAHFLENGQFERRRPHPDVQMGSDPAMQEWSVLNAPSRRRTNLLVSAVGANCRVPRPEEAALTAFLKASANARCVTFDIFDTLVERRTGKPETVFAILDPRAREAGFVGEDFVAVRKAAELDARALAGEREVTIAEIYDAFARLARIPLEQSLALADAECALEIDLCERKAIGGMLFATAQARGLPIHLLSDIYMPQATVEAIVAKAGISGFDRLLVSSEIGATKHYGTMFDHLIDRLDIAPEHILHIGDNAHSDVSVPRSKGMHALLLQKSDAMTASAALGKWFAADPARTDGFWKSVVSGNLIHREGTLHGSMEADRTARAVRMYGAQALGPALLAFAQWLGRRARILGYQRLYFAARDGFYLKEAFDLLRRHDPELPETAYLLASRKVCRSAGVTSLEDMLDIAAIDHYPMPVRQFLQIRLLLTDADIKTIDPARLNRVVRDARTDADLHRVIKELSSTIQQRCDDHREAYDAYLRQIGLDQHGAAIVDIGYRGTVQHNLSDMLGKPIDGLYFVTWPAVSALLSKGLRYSTFIASGGTPDDPMVRYVQLLELLMSATHGSISHFAMDANGQSGPVMLETDTHPQARHTLNALRGGALEFMDDVLRSCPALAAADSPIGSEALATTFEFFMAPPAIVVKGLADHMFEDLFGGETRALVIAKGQASDMTKAFAGSCWKEGTLALWRDNENALSGEARGRLNDTPDRFEGITTVSGATLA